MQEPLQTKLVIQMLGFLLWSTALVSGFWSLATGLCEAKLGLRLHVNEMRRRSVVFLWSNKRLLEWSISHGECPPFLPALTFKSRILSRLFMLISTIVTARDKRGCQNAASCPCKHQRGLKIGPRNSILNRAEKQSIPTQRSLKMSKKETLEGKNGWLSEY